MQSVLAWHLAGLQASFVTQKLIAHVATVRVKATTAARGSRQAVLEPGKNEKPLSIHR